MKFPNVSEHRFAIAFIVLAFVAVPAWGQPKPSPQGAKLASVPTQLPAMRRVVTKSPARSLGQYSVARLWHEAMLDAIRRDTPRPPIHARNLFHVSAAMYDAWAAYDPTAVGYFRVEPPPCKPSQAKQEVAISYAAYRVLSHRFARSPGHTESQNQFYALMSQLRQNPHNTNRQGFSPAAIGNRIGQAIIEFGLHDGANEQHDFADTSGYAPGNLPLIFNGIPTDLLADINRWQRT